MVPLDFVESFTTFLNRERISYAVIGAFALGAYGYVRATRDVDFVTGLQFQAPIITWLESLGFETLHRSTGFSNHLHPLGDKRIDLLYVDDRTLSRLMADAQTLPCINELALPVVSALHLVELKLFAVKNDPSRLLKDCADVQWLLGHVSVDRERVRLLFVKYGLESEWANVNP